MIRDTRSNFNHINLKMFNLFMNKNIINIYRELLRNVLYDCLVRCLILLL